MRNRAKCKLCLATIESKEQHDFVSCVCGEISIDGGPVYFKASAKNFENFLRIDDDGNEVQVKFKDQELASPETSPQPTGRLSRAELLDMLEETLKGTEKLPPHALYAAPTHADVYSLGVLILAILRAS